MSRSLLFLMLLASCASAREKVTVGQLAPGMTQVEVIRNLGQPGRRVGYGRHAYIVFSSQPLFPQEQTWYYQGPDGESTLLFQGTKLRLVRAQTLEWRGLVYGPESWPAIQARVESACKGMKVGFARTPIVRGFVLSNLTEREENERKQRYDRISGKHHFTPRGDLYSGKPGQVCQTCLQQDKSR